MHVQDLTGLVETELELNPAINTRFSSSQAKHVLRATGQKKKKKRQLKAFQKRP